MKKLFYAVLGSLLVGCGSDLSSQNFGGGFSNQVGPSSVIAGKVVDERGAPLPGVRLVTHERISDEKAETISGSDGSFSLAVPQGVYDLGLDKEGDNSKATCFYGPIDTSSAAAQNYVLRDSGGRPVDQLFGKLWLRPGVPAANHPLILRAGQRSGGSSITKPAPVNSSTAGDGTFAVQIGADGEVGLDLEVYEGGILDEFIDVAKRNKPCYVEFSTDQSPVENLLRNNQGGRVPSTGKTSGALGASGDLFQKFASLVESPSGTVTLSNGLLPVHDDYYRKMKDISPDFSGLSSKFARNSLEFGWIAVDTKHSWYWGKYAVEIWVVMDTDWTFYDESGDSYSLYVLQGKGSEDPNFNPADAPYSNKVSYSSSRPNINKIDFSSGF